MQEKEKEVIKNYLDKVSIEYVEVGKRIADAGDYWKGLENYITNKAKEYLHSQSGMVEDSLVFNWCFDYFHDEEYTKTSKPADVKPVTPTTQNSYVPKMNKSKKDEGQLTLW